MDLRINPHNDLVMANIKTMRLDLNNKYSQKSLPEKNTMNMNENEYKDFLNSFSLTLSTLKEWLNDVVFIEGFTMPYRIDEFRTGVSFKDSQMHINLDVEGQAYEFIDDELDIFQY